VSYLQKYEIKRYELFSRYDEGVYLDEESFYSVTPERIAEYLGQRLKCGTILDGFCGCGGNLI